MEFRKAKIAFLGATGGCASQCLALSLKDGYECVALARTPSKLTDLMKAKHVPQSTIDKNLNIVQGDVRDLETVKDVLAGNVDIIVSSIGGYPTTQWSLTRPVVAQDKTLCADAATITLDAAKSLYAGSSKKPFLVNISTTGIQPDGQPRDIPILYGFIYHWLLKEAHEDKRIMEQKCEAHSELPDAEKGIRGYVNVKPTLLMDGDGKGIEGVRDGTSENPAIGYTIQRDDVGTWIFERIIKTNDTPAQQKWINQAAFLTN